MAKCSVRIFCAGEETAYDIFRDSPLRYMGYANEVGEALAAFLPVWGVPFSYAVAISYVLADTGDKAYLEWERNGCAEDDPSCTIMTKKLRFLLAGSLAFDTVLWQMLAAVSSQVSVRARLDHIILLTMTRWDVHY